MSAECDVQSAEPVVGSESGVRSAELEKVKPGARESAEGSTDDHKGNGSVKRGHWIPPEWAVRLKQVEPWPEAVNGKELLDEIAQTVERFVVLGKWAVEAITLWILHTYAFELRDVTTYLGIESPQHRCGKSTLLDVMGRLVNRPLRSANISTPAFFRAIAETDPALLIDEADTFLHNEELRGIINSGYQRDGAFVMRVTHEQSSSEASSDQNGDGGAGTGDNGVAGGMSRLVNFSCWCPKAIARIGKLPQVLADRCIVITMQRKLPTETRERLKNLNNAEALRRKCARFVQDHAEEIRKANPAVPEGMNDRAGDIWEPLLVLADLAGGEWPERARKSATALSLSGQESDPMGSLLMDILELFLRWQRERVFTKDVADWLNLAEDRPWMVLKKGKKITGQWVAQQLQAYGIRPKTLRIGDERAKGYEMDDFREAFRRYIPRGEYKAFRADVEAQWAMNEELRARQAKGPNGE